MYRVYLTMTMDLFVLISRNVDKGSLSKHDDSELSYRAIKIPSPTDESFSLSSPTTNYPKTFDSPLSDGFTKHFTRAVGLNNGQGMSFLDEDNTCVQRGTVLKTNDIRAVDLNNGQGMSYLDDDHTCVQRETVLKTNEYLIDLAKYFSQVIIDDINSDLLEESVTDFCCEFLLQDSGYQGKEVIITIPYAAAQKIINHNNRASSLLTVKEIQTGINGDLLSNIISFEPSGVVFSRAMEDGGLDRKDCILVSIPTVMTWEGNEELNRSYVLTNLEVVTKHHENDDHWQPCFDQNKSGDDFNGVLDINRNDGESRIIATFIVDHFSCFSTRSSSSLFRRSAYALCAIRIDDGERSFHNKSSFFNIQCCVCEDDPYLSTIIAEKCHYVVQPIHWKTMLWDHLHAKFQLTSYEEIVKGYHLLPVQGANTNVEITDVVKEYVPDFNRNLGRYSLMKESEDLRLRSHIELSVNKKFVLNRLIIEIPVPVVPMPIPATNSAPATNQPCTHQSSAYNYKVQ